MFYFFLLLGISDPLNILLIYTAHLDSGIIFVIIAPFLFYSINIDRKKPFKINAAEIFVFVLAYSLIPIVNNNIIIIVIIDLLILLRIIFKIIIDLHHNQKLNVFYLVMAFYETSCVASLIILLNGDYQGMLLFYINLSFQTLIAIFFSIFREDHPKLTYKITPA